MTKTQILDALRELGEALDDAGMTGEILLTGGASMCLVHGARDMTQDVDALYEPKAVINQMAAGIAERHELPVGWLNDGVKGFLTPGAPAEDFMSFRGLRVQTVSPEYLLAMKLMSARYGETDYGDIRFLFDMLDIRTYGQAETVLAAFYDIKTVPVKTKYVIESIFEGLYS
jgi:hypothetical protein